MDKNRKLIPSKMRLMKPTGVAEALRNEALARQPPNLDRLSRVRRNVEVCIPETVAYM